MVYGIKSVDSFIVIAVSDSIRFIKGGRDGAETVILTVVLRIIICFVG